VSCLRRAVTVPIRRWIGHEQNQPFVHHGTFSAGASTVAWFAH